MIGCHYDWVNNLESSIAKDINAVNPNFDLDTHVDVTRDQ